MSGHKPARMRRKRNPKSSAAQMYQPLQCWKKPKRNQQYRQESGKPGDEHAGLASAECARHRVGPQARDSGRSQTIRPTRRGPRDAIADRIHVALRMKKRGNELKDAAARQTSHRHCVGSASAWNDFGVQHSIHHGRNAQRQIPRSGPEAPTSKSARIMRIGERSRINAPKVPISVGAGIKNG